MPLAQQQEILHLGLAIARSSGRSGASRAVRRWRTRGNGRSCRVPRVPGATRVAPGDFVVRSREAHRLVRSIRQALSHRSTSARSRVRSSPRRLSRSALLARRIAANPRRRGPPPHTRWPERRSCCLGATSQPTPGARRPSADPGYPTAAPTQRATGTRPGKPERACQGPGPVPWRRPPRPRSSISHAARSSPLRRSS